MGYTKLTPPAGSEGYDNGSADGDLAAGTNTQPPAKGLQPQVLYDPDRHNWIREAPLDWSPMPPPAKADTPNPPTITNDPKHTAIPPPKAPPLEAGPVYIGGFALPPGMTVKPLPPRPPAISVGPGARIRS